MAREARPRHVMADLSASSGSPGAARAPRRPRPRDRRSTSAPRGRRRSRSACRARRATVRAASPSRTARAAARRERVERAGVAGPGARSAADSPRSPGRTTALPACRRGSARSGYARAVASRNSSRMNALISSTDSPLEKPAAWRCPPPPRLRAIADTSSSSLDARMLMRRSASRARAARGSWQPSPCRPPRGGSR